MYDLVAQGLTICLCIIKLVIEPYNNVEYLITCIVVVVFVVESNKALSVGLVYVDFVVSFVKHKRSKERLRTIYIERFKE